MRKTRTHQPTSTGSLSLCIHAVRPDRELVERSKDLSALLQVPRMQKRHLDGGVCPMPFGNQCRVFAGVAALGGVMNDPTGTTTCFGFLGFFASLFPRNWPFAMVILLAVASEVSGLDLHKQTQHRLIIGRCAGMGDLLRKPLNVLRIRMDAVMLPTNPAPRFNQRDDRVGTETMTYSQSC